MQPLTEAVGGVVSLVIPQNESQCQALAAYKRAILVTQLSESW